VRDGTGELDASMPDTDTKEEKLVTGGRLGNTVDSAIMTMIGMIGMRLAT